MELIKELLFNYCTDNCHYGDIGSGIDVERIIEKECYKALSKIKEIIGDDSIEDDDCFERIERIVCLFEDMGIDIGGRHDF